MTLQAEDAQVPVLADHGRQLSQTDDPAMARTIWRNLLSLLYRPEHPDGFRTETYGFRADGTPLAEIPWITTNFTAQWCLKAMVTAELIPGTIPESFEALDRELREHPPEYRLYGA